MNCAWVHANGVAENVGVPGANPAVPDGGFWSQTCSGSIPPSLATSAIEASCCAAPCPAASSYSPRSPAKIGQTRPIVVWLPGGWLISQGPPLRCSP